MTVTRTAFLSAVLWLISMPQITTTGRDEQAGTAALSRCPVSADPGFGYTPDSPIKSGGGTMYGPAREQRYLSALRGPAGEAIHYRRLSSLRAPDGKTILDDYEVTYEGAPKALHLYLDEYHFAEPIAPKGFLCGVDFNLPPPGPDPLEVSQQMISMAVERGSAAEITPISLDSTGPAIHGVVYDHFRLVAQAAHAAAAAGSPLKADALPRDIGRVQTVVIAYPLACGGQAVVPESIDLEARGQSAPRLGGYLRGEQIRALVAGVQPRAGSLAADFGVATLVNSIARIKYGAGDCAEASSDVTLPLRIDPARPMKTVTAKLPEGALLTGEPTVMVQVVIDFDGVPRFPAYVSGPPNLIAPALAAASQWQWTPPRVNGAPILTTTSVAINVR